MQRFYCLPTFLKRGGDGFKLSNKRSIFNPCLLRPDQGNPNPGSPLSQINVDIEHACGASI